MDAHVIWLVAAGLLVAIEMTTGTFYLLMIAIGAVAAGVAALAGAMLVGQFLAAATISVVGIFVVRKRRVGLRGAGEKTNIAFDAGQAVEVIERHADGSLRVAYRGSQWDAELEDGVQPATHPVSYRIKEMRGSRLVLTARK
jgi:membrane protein implicated in regulation of membrane protease activity